MPGIDRQGRQHREHQTPEVLAGLALGVSVQRIPASQVDALLGQGGQQVPGQQRRCRLHLGPNLNGDAGQLFAWTEPIRGRVDQRRFELLVQPGDPDHEELVLVGGVDGQELQALEQGIAAVEGLAQHPLVERQPGHLPVEEQGRAVQVRLRRMSVRASGTLYGFFYGSRHTGVENLPPSRAQGASFL